MENMKNGSALKGIKVLDLGRVLAAPFCTAILADMGADVIKIEQPGIGDLSRDYFPKKDGVSTYFINFNRSKRGITLDLKKQEGREIFLKLVKETDVLVENFRPGVMKKLGLTYEALITVNPKLIYASISGFGQEGPYAERAGFDPIAQAMAGMVSVTGPRGSEGVRCGASIADVMAAQNAVMAILAALRYRDMTGKGQMIDVALTDAVIIALSSLNQVYLTTGVIPKPMGSEIELGAPGGNYPCKDGHLMILAGAEQQWVKLCNILGHDEWTEIPEFISNDTRVKNREKLNATIGAVTKTMITEELLDKLLSAGLPAGPILNIAQVTEDAHFQGVRQMFTAVEHPELGTVRIINQGFKMSETNPHVRGCSPRLGEHNKEVYTSLGYTGEEIRRLEKDWVI